MSDLKLCKNCRHARPVRLLWIFKDWTYARCLAPTNNTPEFYVAGDRGRFCDLSREYGPCHRAAVLFEPKDHAPSSEGR